MCKLLGRSLSMFYFRYLTGNPCTDYEGYREFVVASLPRLEWLDGKEVSHSERILATQRLPELRKSIAEQQEAYARKRVRMNTVGPLYNGLNCIGVGSNQKLGGHHNFLAKVAWSRDGPLLRLHRFYR